MEPSPRTALESPARRVSDYPGIPRVPDDSAYRSQLKAQSRASGTFGDLTPLQFAVAALILISIGRAHDHISILAAVRPALLLTASCLLIAIVRPKAISITNLTHPWPPKAIGALLATALAASVFGLSFGSSASYLLSSYFPILTLFCLTTLTIRRSFDLQWIIGAYVLSVVVVSFASIFLSQPVYIGGSVRQGGAGMYDGNDIGVVLMVGLPFAMILLRSRHRFFQGLAALAILGALVSLVLAASRGGFLGLIAGGAAILFLSPGLRGLSKLGIAVTAVLSFAFLAPETYRSQMSTILNPQEDYNITSATGRLAIWTRGLGYVQEYPIFGVGPDNFIRAGWTLSDQGQAGLFGAGLRAQAPHNTFLQVWTEMGTVGLLVWLFILGWGLAYPLYLRRKMPRSWLARGSPQQRLVYLSSSYLPASFIGFAVTSFFVSHAYTAIFYVMVAIATGFVVVARQELRRARESNVPTLGRQSHRRHPSTRVIDRGNK